MTSERRAQGLAGADYTLGDLLSLRHAASRLKLSARVMPVSWRAGMHQSRIRGRGMSFAESRLYQSGDDVRLIDWRVTARSGRPHTKIFEEEKERPVVVVVDFAPSMYFGTQLAFKHVVAAEVAALIGWAALSGGDRIGALLSSGTGHRELRPAAGRRALMRLLHELAAAARPTNSQGGSIALSETVRRAAQVVRPGSLIFLVGDFYDFDAACSSHVARLAQHNDVVLCQVLDRLELFAPPAGRYPVSDGDRVREFRVRRRVDGKADHGFGARLVQPARSLARRYRLLHGLVSAGEPVVEQLDALLCEGRTLTKWDAP